MLAAPETVEMEPGPPPAPARRWRIRLRPSPAAVTRSFRWGARVITLRQANRATGPHDPARENVLETEDADLAYYLLAQGIYEEVR